LQKCLKKQKIIPWLTEQDDVINITPLPHQGTAFSARARGGRLWSDANAGWFQVSVFSHVGLNSCSWSVTGIRRCKPSSFDIKWRWTGRGIYA